MPATGALIGTPPSISDREDAHTDAIEVEPFDESTSDTRRRAYGHSSRLGTTGSKRPLGEHAVADLATLGATHAACLTIGVGRHVVVVHVALLGFRTDRVEHLVHARHAEREDVQHLGLAPLEQA